jgi:hypothetical protein
LRWGTGAGRIDVGYAINQKRDALVKKLAAALKSEVAAKDNYESHKHSPRSEPRAYERLDRAEDRRKNVEVELQKLDAKVNFDLNDHTGPRLVVSVGRAGVEGQSLWASKDGSTAIVKINPWWEPNCYSVLQRTRPARFGEKASGQWIGLGKFHVWQQAIHTALMAVEAP